VNKTCDFILPKAKKQTAFEKPKAVCFDMPNWYKDLQ